MSTIIDLPIKKSNLNSNDNYDSESDNEKCVYEYLNINIFDYNSRIVERVKIFHDGYNFYIYKYGVKTIIELSKYSHYPDIYDIDCISVISKTVYDKSFDDDCITSNISLSTDDNDTYTISDSYNDYC